MTFQTADIVESVTAKLQDLPRQQQQQVLDFVEFLAQKYAKPKSNQPRVAGLHRGMGWISDDFNDPIPPEYWSSKE